MLKFMKKMVNRYHYSIASIKNRYPCKIIKIKDICDLSKSPSITYQAVTKLNICKKTVKEILDDPVLVEKFHPTDAVKFGFIAFGDILLNEGSTIEESRVIFKKIAKEMFSDLER